MAPDDIYNDAVKMIEDSFNDNAEQLAQILYNDTNIPADLSIKVDGNNIITTIFTKKELSNEELNTFMEWFEGECDDGWGESLEQEEVNNFKYKASEALDFLKDIPHERISEYVPDNIDCEKWGKYKEYDIPDQKEDNDEYNRLYREYKDDYIDINADVTYYANVWSKHFEISEN